MAPKKPIIDASWYQRNRKLPRRTSAGGVVLRKDGRRWLIALAREGDFIEYVLPKGGVEEGESLAQAAQREIEEEAGLARLVLVGRLGQRSRLTFTKTRWVTVHYYLFLTDQVRGQPTDQRKHIHPARWFPLNQLPYMLWPEQVELLKTTRRKMLQMAERKHKSIVKGNAGAAQKR